MTQNEKVLKYIQYNGSITTFEAFSQLGITRLSARIYDLKKLGYEFISDTVYKKNYLDEFVHFTRYRLKD